MGLDYVTGGERIEEEAMRMQESPDSSLSALISSGVVGGGTEGAETERVGNQR